MFRTVELVFAIVFAIVLGAMALSRRFPQVAWLKPFRRARARLTEEQRARFRRQANIDSGAKLILMGLSLPVLYLAATVMAFKDLSTALLALVLAGSLLLIGLGATVMWRSGSR